MTKKTVLVIVCMFFYALPVRVLGCGNHAFYDPDKLGFFGGAVVRLAGLAPPKPVFELDYPPMTNALVGEDSEITISYTKPYFSKNVRLQVSGTDNISLSKTVILLDDRSGSISIPYQLKGPGYNLITLDMSGEHEGEVVHQKGQVYVRARQLASE